MEPVALATTGETLKLDSARLAPPSSLKTSVLEKVMREAPPLRETVRVQHLGAESGHTV